METAANTAAAAATTLKKSTHRFKRKRGVGLLRRNKAAQILAPAAAEPTTANSTTQPATTTVATAEVLPTGSEISLAGDAASVTALSVAEKAPDLASFCGVYRPLKRPKRPEETVREQEDPAENTNNSHVSDPVVTIVDGEIVLQQQPIVQPLVRVEEMTTVVEDEVDTAIISASYNSYAKRPNNSFKGWRVEETQLFYEALRDIGLDFGTMVAYFGEAAEKDDRIRKRTRRQLKNKHRLEVGRHPELVQKAIWGVRREKSNLIISVEMKAPEEQEESLLDLEDGDANEEDADQENNAVEREEVVEEDDEEEPVKEVRFDDTVKRNDGDDFDDEPPFEEEEFDEYAI